MTPNTRTANRPAGRRLLVALAASLLLSLYPHAAGAAVCDNTSVGFKPMIDLGTGTYKGRQGGLYPGGINKRPTSHTNRGVALAKGQVVPRRADGKIDAKNGKLVFLSVGMSNTEAEFKVFIGEAKSDPKKSSRVVVVNGAQKGVEAGEAAKSQRYWATVDERLSEAGATPEQVGVIWLKETDGSPQQTDFELYVDKLEEDLATIVEVAKERFPNLWIVYVSTRIYGGYASSQVSPEPWAYQDGFAAKGLIERQLSGSMPVGTSAPWLSWGPYMWADGLRARSDGLTWACSDFQPDGVHPSRTGAEKVTSLLLNFLHTDTTAKIWYAGATQTPGSASSGDGSTGEEPSDGSPRPTPTTTASAAPSSTASASPGTPPLAAPADPPGGFPWTVLLLAIGPAAGFVIYRLLRGERLWPRRRPPPQLPAG